jgi:hypothetical protein
VYEADLTVPFTRGYVHATGRNHSTVKYEPYNVEWVWHWDNIGFDGPILPAPRAYEIPDNLATGGMFPEIIPTEPQRPYKNLGYEVSDGTVRQQRLWDGVAHINPFSIPNVDVANVTAAQLTLNFFANAVTDRANVTWGLKFRFNSGTWRTRFLTASEVAAVNTTGSAGHITMVADVPTGDLIAGTNTLEFDTVNIPQSYAPMVANIDLLLAVSSSALPQAPTNLRIVQ